MIRICFLVFATINVAWCNDKCPAFSAFDDLNSNGNLLPDLLDSTFSVVYTTATPIHSCQKFAFETDASNVIIGRIHSPGCCIEIFNNNFTSTELTYNTSPVPCYANKCQLLGKEKGAMKLLGKTGSRETLCLIIALCQPSYYGINVVCRGSPPPLQNIENLLLGSLGDRELIDALNFQSVSQSNCPENDCPL